MDPDVAQVVQVIGWGGNIQSVHGCCGAITKSEFSPVVDEKWKIFGVFRTVFYSPGEKTCEFKIDMANIFLIWTIVTFRYNRRLDRITDHCPICAAKERMQEEENDALATDAPAVAETTAAATSAAQTVPPPPASPPVMITLISRDEKNFQLPKAAAVLSGFIKDTLDIDDEDEEPDSYQPVHVLRVDGDCLQKVVDFLIHYQDDPLPEIRQPLAGNSLHEVYCTN
jgi:Skp1 family, tetramerisation domain